MAIMALISIGGWIQGQTADDTVVGLVLTVSVAAVCFGIYAMVRFVIEPRTWRRVVRLILFCRSNGFVVEPVAEQRALPGTLGELLGQHRSVSNRMTWLHDGTPVEVGRYQEASWGASGSAFGSLPRRSPGT